MRKGQKMTIESRKKLSNSQKGLFAGEKHPRWGIKLSDEVRLKISNSEKGKIIPEDVREKMSIARMGEKNPAWKGGKSFEKYTLDWNNDFKDSIRKRDNYICQECGIHQDELSENWHKKLDVHHIDYNKKNCDPSNLISLCRECHTKTNFNRDYWLNYFKNNE